MVKSDRYQSILDAQDPWEKGFRYDFKDCEAVVVYRFYLDESGVQDKTGFIVLAGCFMEIDEWVKLVDEWRKILDFYQLSVCHCTDIYAGYYEGKLISSDIQRGLFRALAEAIFARDYHVWHGYINKEDYRVSAPQFPTKDFTDFEFLFGGVFQGSLSMMKKMPPGRIGIVIEKGCPQIRPHVRRYIERFARYEYGIEFDPPWQEAPKSHPEVQVADYIAWHYNRLVVNGVKELNNDRLPFLAMVAKVQQDEKRRFWYHAFLNPEISEILRIAPDRKDMPDY